MLSSELVLQLGAIAGIREKDERVLVGLGLESEGRKFLNLY